MNAALLVRLLMGLRTLAPDVFPGPWAWAVSLLGVGVGLLPAVGALLIASVRKTVGSHYGIATSVLFAATGVLCGGLLPLLTFLRVGHLFAGPAAFGRATVRELGAAGIVGATQRDYLGGVSVSGAFTGSDPLWLAYAILMLALVPLVVTMLVYVLARLAVRRGPRWPARFLWVPVLALSVLTAGVPAGTAGQLWAGIGVGALLGIVVVGIVGPPARAVVQRSLHRARRPPTAPTPVAHPVPRPGSPGGYAAGAPSRPTAARPTTAGPPAVAPPRSDGRPPTRPTPGPPTPARGHRPTLIAPAPAPPVGAGAAGAGARFQLIRRLGSGGFGRVWLARDAKLGHVVAVKAAHAPDAETEQRIQREARALASVRHPHCVRIHDLVPARSDPGLTQLDGMVIVMGYVEGESLGELVRSRGLLDDVAAARVWVNLAGALDAAHQQGVMHRDVKPANVVVDPAGRAHLIDFGIARTSGDATMTQAGFVLGTPDFLAPEIACGERATAASDAWQLAAAVSYALTGSPPRGQHADAVSGLRAAAAGAPMTHLPPRTAHLALLRAALDNDPSRRPALRDVQRALDGWLRRQGAPASGPVTAGARPS